MSTEVVKTTVGESCCWLPYGSVSFSPLRGSSYGCWLSCCVRQKEGRKKREKRKREEKGESTQCELQPGEQDRADRSSLLIPGGGRWT